MSGDGEDLRRLVRRLNSSKMEGQDGIAEPVPSAPSGADSSRLDALLQEAVRLRASDLLLVAGFPPSYRLNGHLVQQETAKLTPAETRAFARGLLDEIHYREFLRDKASDFVYESPQAGRFRCDLHHQQGTIAVSIRTLPRAIPTLADLNLPASIARFAQLKRGLVLFVGPTGCGKSTSMAALLEIINRTRSAHILTIEDPIEYLYIPERCVVEQVEVGRDTVSFAAGLRHALRQNPDVLLVGEMRDLETISVAIRAAETGHLVFSTLHTGDASQTIDRLIDAFPDLQQNQIRQQLSLSIAGIVAQTLVPTADGNGRVPAAEILLANDAVRNLIRTGKGHLLYSQITLGRKEGMMTMEDCLAGLVRSGRISREEAVLRAGHREELDTLLA